MNNQSRRDFLFTTGAIAAAAVARDAPTSPASAEAAASSEWDYRTTKEIAAALKARKISAAEFTEHVIARIDKLDQKLNAVVVRDFERAREAAKAAGARRTAAAPRHPDGGQGILQRRRPADDLGHSGVQGLDAAGGRGCDHPPQNRRRRHPRQDQRADQSARLAELQRHLRHHQQSLGSRPHARRLVRRIGRGAHRRLRTALARLRHRRLAAGAGALLRRLWP